MNAAQISDRIARISLVRLAMLPVLAATMVVGACDDPTTTIDEHPEAEGFVITEQGVELVRWMRGDAQPQLDLEVGGIHDLVITMLDEDGQPLAHVDEGEADEEEIVVTIGNPSIATWTPEPEDGEAHEFIEAHGELRGLSTGSTIMEICLLHGDHCEIEPAVTLNVQ